MRGQVERTLDISQSNKSDEPLCKDTQTYETDKVWITPQQPRSPHTAELTFGVYLNTTLTAGNSSFSEKQMRARILKLSTLCLCSRSEAVLNTRRFAPSCGARTAQTQAHGNALGQ